MSINTIGNNSTAPEQRSNAQGTQKASAAASTASNADQSSAPKTGDTVHISSRAVDLHALEATIKQMPEVDSQRVSDLRERISNGEYQIDSSRLAEKILKFESDL